MYAIKSEERTEWYDALIIVLRDNMRRIKEYMLGKFKYAYCIRINSAMPLSLVEEALSRLKNMCLYNAFGSLDKENCPFL